MFLIESSFMGVVGGSVGCLTGALFSICVYVFTYGAGLTAVSFAQGLGRLAAYAALSLAAGVILSVLAAIYPASVASRMVPADALRTNV
jgi:ABC-type antimicrobial peptide transport system permease subunit